MVKKKTNFNNNSPKRQEVVAKRITGQKKLMLDALESEMGIIASAAKRCGISRSLFFVYIEEDPEFRAAVRAIQSLQDDFVENKLMKAIAHDSVPAIIYYCSTKMTHRNYGYKKAKEEDEGVNNDKIAGNILSALEKQLIAKFYPQYIKDVTPQNPTIEDKK